MESGKIKLGTIKKLPIQKIWGKEAQDFTPWLRENLNELSDVIGLQFSSETEAETEYRTENFRIDIVAYAGENQDKKVIIENQYGASNHDHLGKLLSYVASEGARYAIWIVEDARSEHIQAVELLNKLDDCKFFLLEVSAFKIDDSAPAIRFEAIVAPEITDDASDVPASIQTRIDLWGLFIKLCKELHFPVFANLKPMKQHWLTGGSGKFGANYDIAVTKDTTYLKFNFYKCGNKWWGTTLFREFVKHKAEIEKDFGVPLVWLEMPDNIHSRITTSYDFGYNTPREEWNGKLVEIIGIFKRFEAAFKPHYHLIDEVNKNKPALSSQTGQANLQ